MPALLLLLLLIACHHSTRLNHSKDLLVVAEDSSPTNLDPRIGIDKASENFHHLLYNGLLRKNEQDRMVPDLASSFEKVSPVLYRFHLKPGVFFHNDKKLDAADVVYTYETILQGKISTTKKATLQIIESVEAHGDDVVEFRLKEPFNGLLINLNIGIIPRDSPADFFRHPIGTGPYRLVAYEQDSSAEFAAFLQYFEGPPRIRRLQLRVIPDATTRTLELKRGSVDLVFGAGAVQPDYLRSLKNNSELHTMTAPGSNYAYLGFNMRAPLLGDPRVRQAIACAINRPAILRDIFRGAAEPATGILPAHHWAYAKDVLHISYDPSRARRLLDEAGWPDPDGNGPRMRFWLEYKTTTAEVRRLVAAVVQSDLQKVGIGLKVRTYEWGTFFSDINHGNFQMCMLLWVGESDPDILRDVFSTTGSRNRGKYSDSQVDEWLRQARVAETEEDQKKYYGLVQKKIAEDCPYVSLWYESNIAVFRKELAGLKLTSDADTRVLKDVYWQK
jgi:peptide/nickel transport system substrate-binding protein